MTNYKSVVSVPQPSLRLTEPTRQPSLLSDVWPAVMQGLLLTAALAFAVGVVAFLVGAATWWRWALGTTALLPLLMYWRIAVYQRTLWRWEQRYGVDLDRPTGQPGQHLATVNAEQARAQQERAQESAEQQAARAALVAFVRRCYEIGPDGKPIGTAEAKHGVKPNDRERYTAWRATLLRLGIARWRVVGKPAAGWLMAVDEGEALRVIGRHVIEV